MSRAWRPIRLDPPLPLAEVATPALLLERRILEANLKRMARHLERAGVGARPHAKTHKCPILSLRQLELGAVGICCAKVSEAEVMVDAGIDRVLVTSPVVTRDKVERVVELARGRPGIEIVVDHPRGAEELSGGATAAGIEVGVLIDLDPGMHRTGVAPGRPALELLERIEGLPGLRFGGLQCYAGNLMHLPEYDERRRRSQETLAAAIETREAIQRSGVEVPVLTVGGTGTFDIDCNLPGVTDLQVGSYLFMDVQYREIGSAEGERFNSFEPSLSVLLTAISQPVPGMITVDGGYKAFAAEDVKPQLRRGGSARYHWGGDEHGILELDTDAPAIELGDRVEMTVSHCDPTVNLYDHYHVVSDGRVEELWPIAARGCSQ